MSEASHWWERRPEAAGALGALGMGLLFGTGFDPLGWQWMSLIALVGFFLVFAARPTPARAALVGFLCGLGWFVPGLSWTMNSIAVYGRLPWAVAALALLVLGAVLSLFPAFACWIAKKIGGGRLATELPALAGVWTLAEWLRGIPMSDLMRGDAVQPLLSLGGADAGILICYENLYGSVVRTFWQSRSPDFLIVTSNLGWFGRSVLGQHLTMSRMRAMESARPLVSVSNTGMSALVNSRGEIAAMLRTDGPDAATMPLLGATGSPTPYVRLGSWPALLASLILALCAVLVRLGTARIRAGKVKGL